MAEPEFRYHVCHNCKSYLQSRQVWSLVRCPICMVFISFCEELKSTCNKFLQFHSELSKKVKMQNRTKTQEMNPYIRFCQVNRNFVYNSLSERDFKKTGRLLGKLWNVMSEEEKQKYK